MENYSRNFRSKYIPYARQEIPIGKCKVMPICWHYQTRLSVYRPIKANIYLAICKQISSNWLVGAHSESLSVFLSHAISMPIFFHAPRLANLPSCCCYIYPQNFAVINIIRLADGGSPAPIDLSIMCRTLTQIMPSHLRT